MTEMTLLVSDSGPLSLSDKSNSLAHCWDVLKVSTVFLSGLWAPVQCSNTGLKMRTKMCEILLQPSNAPNCCSCHSDLKSLVGLCSFLFVESFKSNEKITREKVLEEKIHYGLLSLQF